MMSNKDKQDKFPIQRAISIFDKKQTKLSNTSFQQIKPKEFNVLVGVLLYKDGLKIYVVPSHLFYEKVLPKRTKDSKILNFISDLKNKGKFILSGQHKNNLEEGQIGFKELEKYLKLSLYKEKGSYFYIEDGKNQIKNMKN